MEHIQNMEYSLLTVQSLFKLIKVKGMALPRICYLCDYDFLDASDYLVEIKKYLLTKPDDNEPLKKTLRQHLDIAKSIVFEGIDTDRTVIDKLFCRFYQSTTSPLREVYTWDSSDDLIYYKCFKIIHTDWPESYFPSYTDEEYLRWENTEIRKEELYIKVQEVKKGLEFWLGDTDEETDNTQPPITISLPDSILNDLAAENLITKNPLKWVASVSLCAYFVDNYFTNHSNLWAIGEELFKVKNLAQSKDNYLRYNESGKPRKYQIIDTILLKNK